MIKFLGFEIKGRAIVPLLVLIMLLIGPVFALIGLRISKLDSLDFGFWLVFVGGIFFLAGLIGMIICLIYKESLRKIGQVASGGND